MSARRPSNGLPERMLHALLHDKLILGVACAAVAVVAWLQNVPERWPFGYEIGITVSAVAYAYIGAWIFNWVIVTRPRAKELRDIYRLAWPMLSLAANDGYQLVRDLQCLADADPRVDPLDDDIVELCKRITYGSSRETSLTDPIESLRLRFDIRNKRIDALMPLLAKAEHDLIVALAEANNTHLAIYPLQDFSDDGKPVTVYNFEGKPPRLMNIANYARSFKEYVTAAENLKKCMASLKYRPGPVGAGVRSMNTWIWEERKLEKLTAADSNADLDNAEIMHRENP